MLPFRIPPLLFASDAYASGDAALDAVVTKDVVTPKAVSTVGSVLSTHGPYRQRVYIRQLWGDTWTLAPYINCHNATWTCAPTIPQAQLTWDFGAIAREGSGAKPTSTIYSPRDIDRWYVRVIFDCDSYTYIPDAGGDAVTENTREWVGVVCFTEHKPLGDLQDGDNLIAQGEQVFSAFGMEKLLAEWYVKKSVYENVPADPDTSEPGSTRESDFLYAFNPLRRGRQTGNRSEHPIDDVYVFSKDPTTTDKWTHEDIVKYLLHHHNPLGTDSDSELTEKIPFVLDDDASIIELEPPELDPSGQTVHSLLCRLIDRRRLVTWFCEYDSGENEMVVKTATMTATNIVLPIKGSPMIPKNRNQRKVYANNDPATTWADRWPAMEVCDQVIARGARRLSIGTFSFGESSLEKGWSTEQETAYQQGASLEAGFADLGTAEKQRRNAFARSRPEVAHVHSLFRIPQTWTFRTGDGDTGGRSPRPTFPDKDDPSNNLPVNYRELFVQPNLPLKEGVNYETLDDPENPPDEAKATGRLLPPLVAFKVPSPLGEDDAVERWEFIHKMAANAQLEGIKKKQNQRITGHIEVPEYYPGFAVKVSGDAQHAIAFTAFTPQADIDPECGQIDYYDGGMRATLAVPDDRYCEGIWPETPPADAESLRIKIIEAGERYRKDYVVPNTLIDIDNAQQPVFSTGGYVPLETDDDDEHQLQALAKIAWNWYGQRHHVIALETKRIKPRAAFMLGYLITTIGSPPNGDGDVTANTLTVNTVITEITINSPKGLPRNGAAPSPMMSFQTWAGELEPEPLDPAPLNAGPSPFVGQAAPNNLTSSAQRDKVNQLYRELGKQFSGASKGAK